MLRYWIGSVAAHRFSARFPVGTLTVNILACFLIGLTVEYLNQHTTLNPAWRFLVPVGFIGGFSTFSTFEWETWMDLTTGAFWMGILYVAVSLIAGLIAVGIGSGVGRSLS